MKVASFMRQGPELVLIEIELTLQPGLPLIHFLGLPDAAVRESALRIRSAVRKQGFRLPQAQQILVQLRPNHLKKTSLGFDLAVAAALLWETKQIPAQCHQLPILYGALSLQGAVEAPEDINEINLSSNECLITGKTLGSFERTELANTLPFQSQQIEFLGELRKLPGPVEAKQDIELTRPLVNVASFPQPAAELGTIIAAGEHSALVAGPAGSGKTTLINSVASWVQEPTGEQMRFAKKSALDQKAGIWRPVVRPHHTISKIAMVGGGNSGWSGEISRAHSGLLIMDELLKFNPEILETLREPVENGHISIARSGRNKIYPARFLFIATTNLCLCGKFIPRAEKCECTCSRRLRAKSIARISGPLLDRFGILTFSEEWMGDATQGSPIKTVSTHAISQQVEKAIAFRKHVRNQVLPNALTPVDDIEKALNSFQRKYHLAELDRTSQRRREAVFRVARTIADLDESLNIRDQHLDRAFFFSYQGHGRLAAWQD